MWSMCIILIVVVLQKHLSQSLQCNTLTNKRFYANVGTKIRVGCTLIESINYCDIGSHGERDRRCTKYKNTEQCPSKSEIKFVGNIGAKTCEFEVEVKTLNDSSWFIGIDQGKSWNFKVFGLHDCFENNMDYIASDQGYAGAVDSTFDCQKICQNTRGCRNWAWVTENGKNGNKTDSPKSCFLKGEKNGSITVENVISGSKNCPGCSETNTLYNADSYDGLQSNSSSDCQSACLSRSYCEMWSFAPLGNCMLFGVENYKGKISQFRFVSGPARCYGCYRLEIGINGKNETLGNSPITATNAIDCQKLCQQTPECKLFNFNIKANNCFLRSGIIKDKLVEVKGSIVGAKDCADPSVIWTTDSPQPLPITTTTTTYSTKATITTLTESTTSSTQPKIAVTAIQEANNESSSENKSDNLGFYLGLISGLSVIVLLLTSLLVCQWFRMRRDINELNNIKKQRSEGQVTMGMLKNEPYEVVEIQTDDQILHEPYEEIILEGEEPYEEIVSEDEVKEPGASPKTPDQSYFFQYYPPPEDDEATGKRDSSYKFEYYKPGQDEEERKSLKSHGSEYVIHQMSDDSE